MSIKAIFFDLDGTLLPMDTVAFSKYYFGKISEKLAPYGYEPQKLIKAITLGIAAMVKNNGKSTNEKACWGAMTQYLGKDITVDKEHFDEFYRCEFDAVKNACGYDPSAVKAVRELRRKGYRTVLATNPLFPSVATEKRIAWAGLSVNDFEIYTSYENCHYSKPNLKYYFELLDKLGLRGDECLMVGNDVDEDMITEQLGMKVFLVTECLINKNNADISKYPNGDFDALLKYVDEVNYWLRTSAL